MRTGLAKNRVLWTLENGSFSQIPAGSMREFISDIYHENLVEVLEVNLLKLWGPSYDWVTQDVLIQSCLH